MQSSGTLEFRNRVKRIDKNYLLFFILHKVFTTPKKRLMQRISTTYSEDAGGRFPNP